MKYTTSKKADKKVEKDIKKIKGVILKEIKPLAIILFGGFGHGGGSFKKLGKGEILPLNDYDFYIITDKKISDENLEMLGRKCSDIIGRGGREFVEDFNEKYDENKFFHVDLHNIPYNKLSSLYPTQRSFDLKTSLIIYGNKKVLDKIPKIEISVSDALRLLFNKLDHFLLAENNTEMIKKIYAVKGFTDLCSAILIFKRKYVSTYQERLEIFRELSGVPAELKKLVEKATDAKLNRGYDVRNVNSFLGQSKKWVEWTLKKLLKEHLNIQQEDWKLICKEMYRKLPYIYFNDYLDSRYLFPAQYYLNLKFFLAGLRKKEFLIKSLIRWRDSGIILAISLILHSFNQQSEAEKYLKKLTSKTKPLKKRILKLYSIYYLQKLI
jgi:hypothetical protein